MLILTAGLQLKCNDMQCYKSVCTREYFDLLLKLIKIFCVNIYRGGGGHINMRYFMGRGPV